MAGAIMILGTLIGASGLLLAIYLAIRNRTFFPTTVNVDFATPFEFENHKPTKRPLPAALFIFNPPGQIAADVRVPIRIWNEGSRKVSDIIVELTYPTAFALTNRQITERMNLARSLFGSSYDDPDEVEGFLEKRKCNNLSDQFRVRYRIGSLRPGEGASFYELMELPPREQAFVDPIYRRKLFGTILTSLKERSEFLAACRVHLSVLSEMNKPIRASINVIAARADLQYDANSVIRAYNDAFWLGEFTPGARYRGKRRGPWWNRRPRLFSTASVDFVVPKVVVRSAPVDDKAIAVSHAVDPGESIYGEGQLCLPGYDVYTLNHDIRTADEAFAKIGFNRVT